MIQTWRIDTPSQTMVLGALENKLPCVVYWGTPLNEAEDLETVYRAAQIDLTGGMLDVNPDLSICPDAMSTFSGQLGMNVQTLTGQPILPELRFESVEQDAALLTLTYKTDDDSFRYIARFETFQDSGIIAVTAAIKAQEDIRLHWLAAPVMPASQSSREMIDFAGHWCGEFKQVHTNWNSGIRCRENRTGRTGHENFPALLIPNQGANNCNGEVYGFHYGWSGGHKMIAEELPDGRRQVQFGHATSSQLKPAKDFETAPLYLAYSNTGFNGCSRSFQQHVRAHVISFDGHKLPRPIHYNCWESVYFDHNVGELKQIANLAAKLGAERFVLDDGWFLNRNDDTSSLGDWDVDLKKYPDGLKPLIDHIHSENMTFGIWFEPEMVSPDSVIYRKNPHWALGAENQTLGRQQKVLNMALSEVQDYLYEKISTILKKYVVDYIKWDHNRVLPLPDASQTYGTYSLLRRLNEEFPQVEIESCASGGGRIDFGILKYTQRVWLSDSNDALERARIQHNSALFLPASITGSHVGPRKCHTSGRVISMSFRAWVAAQRHMGFEMDPRELDEDEVKTLTKVTTWWKDNRFWMMHANILRLDSDDDVVLAEQHLSEDESQFVVFANHIDSSTQISPRPLRFARLDCQRMYKVELVNREDLLDLSRGNPFIKNQDVTLSGQYLMTHGLVLPWSFPNSCWVLKGEIA